MPCLFLYIGFPKKDVRSLKIKNIPDLLSDDKEGEIMWNIDLHSFSNGKSCSKMDYGAIELFFRLKMCTLTQNRRGIWGNALFNLRRTQCMIQNLSGLYNPFFLTVNFRLKLEISKMASWSYCALCSHLLYLMFIHVSFVIVFTHIKTKMGNFLGSRDGGVEAEPGKVWF